MQQQMTPDLRLFGHSLGSNLTAPASSKDIPLPKNPRQLQIGKSSGFDLSFPDSNGTNSSSKHDYWQGPPMPPLKIGATRNEDPFPKIAASKDPAPSPKSSESDVIKCQTDADCPGHNSHCYPGSSLCYCFDTGMLCKTGGDSQAIQKPTNHSDSDGAIPSEDFKHIANLGPGGHEKKQNVNETTVANIVHRERASDDQSTVVNIVVPLALIVFLSLIVSIICLRRQRKHRLRPKRSAETMVKSSDGVMLLDRMNNINKNPSYFTSLHDHHDDLSRPHRFLAPEICMDYVVLVDVVGEGAFGQVYRGEILWPETNSKQLVAVKVLKENVSHEIREDFEREVEIMSAFDHDNILKLVGVVTQNAGQSPYMIFEYMVHGDLAELLRRNEPCSYQHDTTGIVRLQKPDLVDIATQIANGMRYLTSQHFVHRDLATRNCLVGEGLVVKISDFGMSRDIYTCDYYKIGGSRMLPVRWMSPESVKFGRFTSESDVWAYGVVLWEIFSSGRQPYYGHSNEEVVRFLDTGILLQRPEDSPSTIYHIMLGCWKADPKERHSFDKIHKHLQDYHERLVKMAAASLPTTPVASKSELRTETPPTTSSSPELLSKSPQAESSGLGSKLLVDVWADPLADCDKEGSLADGPKESSLLSPEQACLNSCWQTPGQFGEDSGSDLPPKTQEIDDCMDVIFQVKLPPPHSATEDEDHKNTSVDPCPPPPPPLTQHADEDEGVTTTTPASCAKLPPVLCAIEDESINSSSLNSCPEPQPDVEVTIEELEAASSPAGDPEEPLSSVLELSGVDSGFSSSEQPWSSLDPDSTISPSVDTGVETLSHVMCSDPAEAV